MQNWQLVCLTVAYEVIDAVFGLSLILIGVVVAGVGLLSGTTSRYAQTAKTDVGLGRQQGEASQSPRISAAVVMVAPASRIAPAPPFADPATALVDQPTLVRDLQRELARLGCYDGAINGMWTAPSARRWSGLLTASMPGSRRKSRSRRISPWPRGRVVAYATDAHQVRKRLPKDNASSRAPAPQSLQVW